jgi:hypothetical protein
MKALLARGCREPIRTARYFLRPSSSSKPLSGQIYETFGSTRVTPLLLVVWDDCLDTDGALVEVLP